MTPTRPPKAIACDLESIRRIADDNLADIEETWKEGRSQWRKGNSGEAIQKAKVVQDVVIGIAGTMLEAVGCKFTILKEGDD